MRYLAPFTANYFFIKVISNPDIAHRILEDILGVTITELKPLPVEYKLTHKAYRIKYDYLCKINGYYVIVEMQQGHLQDVVKRFYLYHGVGVAVQLEDLPVRIDKTGKRKTRDYSGVLPVITLVWMADDGFKTKEDMLNYRLYPSEVANFIKNEELWKRGDIEELRRIRATLLTMLNYDKKDLDFLPKNQLIFAFQQNILKNKKQASYLRWFEFAQKTRKKNNTQQDFSNYVNDKTFLKIMDLLTTDTMTTQELNILYTLDELEAEKERIQAEFEAKKKNIQAEFEAKKKNIQAEFDELEAEKKRIRTEFEVKKKNIQAEKENYINEGELRKSKAVIANMLAKGFDITVITDVLNLPESFVIQIKKEIR